MPKEPMGEARDAGRSREQTGIPAGKTGVGAPYQRRPSPLQPRRRLHPNHPAVAPVDHADGQHSSDGTPSAPRYHAPQEKDEAELDQSTPIHAMHKDEANEAAHSKGLHKEFSELNTTSNGPYQAVVVFLLLLMVLVIIGVVYQLFFRPNPGNLPENLNGNVISKLDENPKEILQTSKSPETSGQISPTDSVEKRKAGEKNKVGQAGKESGTKMVEDNALKQSSATAEQKKVQRVENSMENTPNISRSSPLSKIMPGGEEIPQRPSAPTPSEKNDSNERLLQSKVGGIAYWIQVGAFSLLNNANSLQAELNQNHLESVIQESTNERSKLYRVRVGLYTSKIEAERILRQLKSIGNSFAQSIIVKTEI